MTPPLQAERLTEEQKKKLRSWLYSHTLVAGAGTRKKCCSLVAINMGLYGSFNVDIPQPMSDVIGTVLIRLNDNMPHEVRNSIDWKDLLVSAADTGKCKDIARTEALYTVAMDQIFPLALDLAHANGIGDYWHDAVRWKVHNYMKVGKSTSCDLIAAANSAIGAISNIDNIYISKPSAKCCARNCVSVIVNIGNALEWKGVDPCQVLRSLILV